MKSLNCRKLRHTFCSIKHFCRNKVGKFVDTNLLTFITIFYVYLCMFYHWLAHSVLYLEKTSVLCFYECNLGVSWSNIFYWKCTQNSPIEIHNILKDFANSHKFAPSIFSPTYIREYFFWAGFSSLPFYLFQ